MLIEGIIIACRAMQSHAAYIYVRGEFVEPILRGLGRGGTRPMRKA